jgi:membrane protein YdbS with pleckstrin-like domain
MAQSAAPVGEERNAMRYIDKVLQPGETVRHVATIHWIIYVPGLVVALAALIVWLMVPQDGWLRLAGLTVAALLLAAALYFLARAWLRRWTTEYAVTDRRVIYKQGLIWRKTMEMNMDKVSSVDVDQSILGRILDYGTVTLHGTGAKSEPISEVGAPLDFRNHITAE